MATKASTKIAVIAAVGLVFIVATIRILDEGVQFHARSIAPQEDMKEQNQPVILQQPSLSSTPNTSSSTKTATPSSFARLPDFSVLRWPASEYEVIFRLSDSPSPLQKMHAVFLNEPRDASWADAMESGIRQAMVQHDAHSDITVAYVVCRSTICEVAGSMPDRMQNPELDPYSLFPVDLGVGWWQGRISMGVGMHTYDGEGITRFIVIIAEPDVFLSASE